MMTFVQWQLWSMSVMLTVLSHLNTFATCRQSNDFDSWWTGCVC